MDVQLIIPKGLQPREKEELIKFIERYEFSEAFDGAISTLESLDRNTVFYARTDKNEWRDLSNEMLHLWTAGVNILLHLDASPDNTYEWSHSTFSMWALDGKVIEYAATNSDAAPLVGIPQIWKILADPEEKKRFIREMETPIKLGVVSDSFA